MLIRSMALEGVSGHEAGQLLLKQMYEKHTGKPMPLVLRSPRGKPYFADGSAHFSISHTKRRVFCVLSDMPVGVDAEETDRQIDLRLAEKILSSAERKRFEETEDKREFLLRLWVLKEASAKLTGEGLQGYPCHTDFCSHDPRIQVIDNCFVAVVE